jgi:hypothetical protein
LSTRIRRQFAEQLNVEGIPSPRGKQWRFALIRRMLTSDVYRGVFIYGKKPGGKYHHGTGGEIVDGPCRQQRNGESRDPLRIEDTHEAIVDPDTFSRTERMLRERKRDTSPYTTKGERYILGGLCRCWNCGHAMTGWTRAGGKASQREYICTGYHEGGKTVCRRNPVRENGLLACVVAKLEEKYLAPANLDRLRAALRKRLDGKATKTDTTATLAKRLASIERKIDEGAERILAAPADLTGILSDKLRAWQGERDDLQRQLAAARSRPPESKRDAERTIDLCIERLRGLRENLHAVDRDKLRTALREIVEEIELQFREVPFGQRTKTELTGGVIKLRKDNSTSLLPYDSTSAQ